MAKTPTITIPSSKVSISLTSGATDASMKAAAAAAGAKTYMVPVDKIETIPGFNVRVDSPDYRAHRDMLAASIAENGYDTGKPLVGYVHKGAYGNVIYITDGHTRLDAVKTLGENAPNFLPVLVRSTAPSVSELTIMLHTNNTGRPLSPFELGVVVKRLMKEDGAEKATVAKRLAVTPRYLDDVLLLVNSPKEIRTAVLNGQVSSTMAIQELRKAGSTVLKAVERIEAAVAKAKASGKAKATAKDADDGVKMKTVKATVSVADGTDMKEIVKAVAAKIREAIPASMDGEGDDAIKLATVDGTINISIELPAPPKAAKAAPAKVAAPAKKTVAKSAAADATPAPKKAAPKKAGSKKTAPVVNAPPVVEDDLGIEGAEEVTSEGADDEVAIMPPAVKNGAGVPADEEVDI